METNKSETEFGRMHPTVSLTYILAVLIISMLTFNPCILAASFIMSAICVVSLAGLRKCLANFLIGIPVIIFTAGIQPLFSRAGHTVLFYINDNAITFESYIYGVIVGVLLISVIQWCSCIGILLNGDRIMYIFGNIIPTLGLTFSMILRFIPLMKDRFSQIHEAQTGLGRGAGPMGLMSNLRLFAKEVSILISWSLESTIETSASMEARGYGIGRRTNYHNYKLKRTDIFAIIYILILFIGIFAGIVVGAADIYYLPEIVFTGSSAAVAGMTVLFIMLAGFGGL